MDGNTIDYTPIMQQALLGAVRTILQNVAENGLTGKQHFYIRFATEHPKTKISNILKAQYPKDITIIIQNQYKDLTVNNSGFYVTLGFGTRSETIFVPFNAIISFSDPAAQFNLNFQPQTNTPKVNTKQTDTPKTDAPQNHKTNKKITDFPKTSNPKAKHKTNEKNTDNVVTLDKFRPNKN